MTYTSHHRRRRLAFGFAGVFTKAGMAVALAARSAAV